MESYWSRWVKCWKGYWESRGLWYQGAGNAARLATPSRIYLQRKVLNIVKDHFHCSQGKGSGDRLTSVQSQNFPMRGSNKSLEMFYLLLSVAFKRPANQFFNLTPLSSRSKADFMGLAQCRSSWVHALRFGGSIQPPILVRGTVVQNELPGFTCWLCHLLPARCWANYWPFFALVRSSLKWRKCYSLQRIVNSLVPRRVGTHGT